MIPAATFVRGNQRAGGLRNPRYNGTFVFRNDFSALLPDVPTGRATDHGLLLSESESGIYAGSSVSCCVTIRRCWKRTLRISGSRRISLHRAKTKSWVQCATSITCKSSRKRVSNAWSNRHPHGQVWAQRNVPGEPAKEIAQMQRHFSKNGTTLLGDYLAVELQLMERIVCQNDHFAALVPFWAIWPFEIMIECKRRVTNLLR